MTRTQLVPVVMGLSRYAAMVLTAALVVAPAQSWAQCSPCTSASPVAEEIATWAAIELDLDIFASSIVDALSGVQTSVTGMQTLQTSVISNAAKAKTTEDGASKIIAATAEVDVANVVDTNDTLCRLHTGQSLATPMGDYKKAVTRALETGATDLATNRNYTPSRLAVGWLYRLCKSGQLRRGTPPDFADSDFGNKWFTANACIDSPVQTHAFLNPTTILDHSILVSPSKDQMDVLNNPESAYPPNPPMPGGTPETVWAALTDKQKLFVGAKLFCENLIMSRMNPVRMSGDQAVVPDNMGIALKSMGNMGKLLSAQALCNNEIARRTAPDAENPDYVGDPVMLTILRRGNKLATFLTANESKNKEDIYAYLTDATGANTGPPITVLAGPDAGKDKSFISPYMIERYDNDYCNSQDVATNISFKPGSESERATGHLSCLMVQQIWDEHEITMRTIFARTAQSIGEIDVDPSPQFNTAPAKARYDGGGFRDGVAPRRASVEGTAALNAALPVSFRAADGESAVGVAQ
jgi:hypothetical protein